ncbi:MAG TPA: hypothetical protein VF624_05240 [Tepidisphaeraceae bacterium]|jgi:hypothetical protein
MPRPDLMLNDARSASAVLPGPRTRLLAWVLIAAIGIAAAYAGTMLRQRTFDLTTHIHFVSDNTRNWIWGTYSFQNMHDRGRSFLDTYDDVGVQDRRSGVWIDYAPARLAVYTGWAAWNHSIWPYQWLQDTRAFFAFFLDVSTVIEIIGAAAAFALVRVVLLQAGASWARSMTLATVAALLLIFSPAAVLSSHGWPNGDIWVVPPFLWAMFFARVDRWLTAGVVLAVGLLFKGQLWFTFPVFLLWPLLQLRWRPPLRLLAGFVATFGLLTTGWTLTTVDPAHVRHLSWPALILTLLPLLLLAVLLVLRRRKPEWRLDRLPRRAAVAAACALAGGAALASMWLFGTSHAWFDASYNFGTNHWQFMTMGRTSNLPGIMQERYGWSREEGPKYVVFQALGKVVTLKSFLLGVFLLTLLIATIGIALQDSRRSTRFLVAIVTPWLLFYTIPCQIHERYLIFAAATACVCVGHSVGMALLGLLMSLITCVMQLHVMLDSGQGRFRWNRWLPTEYPGWFAPKTTFATDLYRVVSGTFPDIGWAVILLALMFLFMSLALDRRRGVVAVEMSPAAPRLSPAVETARPVVVENRRPPVRRPDDPIPLVDPLDMPPKETL